MHIEKYICFLRVNETVGKRCLGDRLRSVKFQRVQPLDIENVARSERSVKSPSLYEF